MIPIRHLLLVLTLAGILQAIPITGTVYVGGCEPWGRCFSRALTADITAVDGTFSFLASNGDGMRQQIGTADSAAGTATAAAYASLSNATTYIPATGQINGTPYEVGRSDSVLPLASGLAALPLLQDPGDDFFWVPFVLDPMPFTMAETILGFTYAPPGHHPSSPRLTFSAPISGSGLVTIHGGYGRWGEQTEAVYVVQGATFVFEAPSPVEIPEPSTLSLMVGACFASLTFRRRALSKTAVVK